MARGKDFFEDVEEKKARDPVFSRLVDKDYADFQLGQELKKAREAAHLTQRELAEKLGMKASNLSRLENHASSMRTATFFAYLNACGKTVRIT